MIRQANDGDRDRIIELGKQFAAELPIPVLVEALVNQVLSEGAAFVSVKGELVVGVLGLLVADHPMTGRRAGVELAWWADPSARGNWDHFRLVEAAEQWAVSEGAVDMWMSALDDRVGRILGRRGYTPTERTYRKALTP